MLYTLEQKNKDFDLPEAITLTSETAIECIKSFKERYKPSMQVLDIRTLTPNDFARYLDPNANTIYVGK